MITTIAKPAVGFIGLSDQGTIPTFVLLIAI